MALRPRWSRRKFLIGVGGIGSGLAAVGLYKTLRPTSGLNLEATASINDLRVSEPFDVCIIGSGPAGAVLGLDLANKGLRTLIIESGALFGGSVDTQGDKLDRFRNTGAIQYPLGTSRVRALGGTSNIWTGRCTRLYPMDFKPAAHGVQGAEWPISYWELEPYYARAEKTLRVYGGRLSGYHAPRRSDLPFPAQEDISGLKSLMSSVGITVDDAPSSLSEEGNGPVRVAQDMLSDFVAYQNAALVYGHTVTKLVPASDGRIVAAELRDLDKNAHTVIARAYIVACGGVESARLLLNSRSEKLPDGVGNRHDLVGRFFTEHPNIEFRAKLERSPSALPSASESGRSHQFYEAFKRKGLGSIILKTSYSAPEVQMKLGATVEMLPSARNRIKLAKAVNDYFGSPAPEVLLSFSERDHNTIEQSRALIRKIYSDLGAVHIEESALSWSHHHIGTCRMGDGPRTGVTNGDLRVHESPNLYVAGSAAFTTGGAAHPTLAIAALSHRLAEHLVQSFATGKFLSTPAG